ncbi:hypothetical protein X1_45 [Yersinia phage vB_Yen_X1]|nr:hypothetical protein X1_45 [Yersinia phage vB_Yen_X1]
MINSFELTDNICNWIERSQMRMTYPQLKDYLLCTHSTGDKYKMNTIYRIVEENESDLKVFKVLNRQGVAQWINLEGLTYQFKPMEVVAMENPFMDLDAFIAGAREYEKLCVRNATGQHCHGTTLHYEDAYGNRVSKPSVNHAATVDFSKPENVHNYLVDIHSEIMETEKINKKRLTDSKVQNMMSHNNVARTMIDSLLDQLKAGEMSPAAIAVALQNIKKEIA